MTRLRFFGWMVIFTLLAFCGFNFYHSNGIVRTTLKNGRGCFCHGDNPSSSVRVEIGGSDSLEVGQMGAYTVSVIKDSNIAAGFNVASFFGALVPGDSVEQQWMEGELTHTVPKSANGHDTISWVFLYEAPGVETIDTLYAAGNSVDTSLDPTGDVWNFSENFLVRVGTPTGIADGSLPLISFRLSQNYPNPFNSSTRITYHVGKTSHVTIAVYDMLGRQISLLINEVQQIGEHEVTFDAANLPSGMYFYRVTAGDASQTKKMILMR